MEQLITLIENWGIYIIGTKECGYEPCTLKNPHFLRLLVSKALGYGIVLGASMVKLPQILKIWYSKSTYGISLVGMLMETYCYLFTTLYNVQYGHPFSSYGEALFMSLQNLVILSFIFYFSRNPYGFVYSMLAYGLMWWILSSGIIGNVGFLILQLVTTLIFSLSRLPQITRNYLQKNTGQLSAITTIALFAGSAARIYTTWMEIQDRLVLISFLMSFVLNWILVFQIGYYWKTHPSSMKQKKSGKTRKNKIQ
jgi:mannose-P-dolichol utilization defect protein 1